MTTVPEPDVLPTQYVVSCLPEGHDDRYTFTVQVSYRTKGQYSVGHRLKFANANGHWDYEPPSQEDDSDANDQALHAWLQAHRFDRDTALALARQLAPTLTYRGRTVADALKETNQP